VLTDLDEALERFQARSFEYAGGLSNHGPMAAEALLQLGHPALIGGFVDLYEPRLPPAESGTPLCSDERAAAVGHADRLGDWRATFERELEADTWQAVLRRELPALVEGLFAAGTHGLLRLAHAVRGIEAKETTPRRLELAFGLAYWAGSYQRLPGLPGRHPLADRGPAEVLARSTGLLTQVTGFLLDDRVRALDGEPRFAAEVEALDPSGLEFEKFLGELCREAARLYLAKPQARIAALHALTAPSALRLIADHLDEATRKRAACFALQAAAALHAITASEGPVTIVPEVEALAESEDEIRYRAASSMQEHAIKFCEAALREHSIAPDPVFRLAAADAAIHL